MYKIKRTLTINFIFFSSHQEDRNWAWVMYLAEIIKLAIQKSHSKNKVELIYGERKTHG